MYSPTVTFRRHEAAYRRTHADDARTPTHDASSSADDDASQAGYDATRQIRASGFPLFFFTVNRRTLGLTLGFISMTFFKLSLQSYSTWWHRLFLCHQSHGIYSCHLINFILGHFQTSFLVLVSTLKYSVSLWQTAQHAPLMSALDLTVFVVLFLIVLGFSLVVLHCIVLINKTVISNWFLS